MLLGDDEINKNLRELPGWTRQGNAAGVCASDHRISLAAQAACEDQPSTFDAPMPLTALVHQLQQVPLTGEVAARMDRPEIGRAHV